MAKQLIGNIMGPQGPKGKDGELKPENFLTFYDNLVEGGDWTLALQTAVDSVDHVHVSSGTYTVGQVNVDSDTVITGDGESTVINSETGNQLFIIEGDSDPTINIVNDVTPHDDKITVENTQGLNVGDTILIKSQRNALSIDDAGSDWSLGSNTGQMLLPFGEYAEIIDIVENTLTLNHGLIYPSYLSHSNNETTPAQTQSTIEKMNFKENIVIKDMKINRLRSGDGVRVIKGKNVIVKDLMIDNTGYTNGYSTAVYFQESYNCSAINCSYYVPPDVTPSEIYYLNVFKISSSVNCGFTECYSENATQAVDFTVINGSIPNLLCYVKESTLVNSRNTGITTHPGNYLSSINDCLITGSNQGISNRGRGVTIANNTVIGDTKTDVLLNYGIGLYEGSSGDSLITSNTVRNFNNGIGHFDSGTYDGRIRYSGSRISENNIINCHNSIYIFRHYTGQDIQKSYMGITITNNTIKLMNRTNNTTRVTGIVISELSNGIIVKDNLIKGVSGAENRTTTHTGIHCFRDVNNLKVIDNTFIDLDFSVYHPGKPVPVENSLWVDPLTLTYRENESIDVVENYIVPFENHIIGSTNETLVALRDETGKRYLLDVDPNGQLRINDVNTNQK